MLKLFGIKIKQIVLTISLHLKMRNSIRGFVCVVSQIVPNLETLRQITFNGYVDIIPRRLMSYIIENEMQIQVIPSL